MEMQNSAKSSFSDSICPSPSDPRILAALAARKLLGEVKRAVDIAGVESLTASDILVNAPINKVVDLKNIIGRPKQTRSAMSRLPRK